MLCLRSTTLRSGIAALAMAATLFWSASPAQAHGSLPYRGPADVRAPGTGGNVAPPRNPALATAPAEDARLTAARTAIEHERADDAERALRDLLDDEVLDADTAITARLMLGELLLDSQRAGDALDLLMPLDEVDAYDAQRLLGCAFTERGHELASIGASGEDVMFHHELGLASLDRAVELAPAGEVDAAIGALELTLYTMGDAEGALTLADRALERAPAAGEVLLLRGCAGGYAFWNASSSGDTERADILWQRAVDDLRAAQAELASDRVEPWVQLAWLGLQKESALGQALDDARQAADRGATAPLFDVAVVGAARGAKEPAAAALYELVERDTQGLTDLLAARDDAASLAEGFSYVIFESDGTYDEAREVHAALTAATRESAAVWNNYGLLCRDTGVFEEAYRAYKTALEISGPDARLLNDTALVLHYHLLDANPEHAATARTMYGQAIDLAEAGLASDALAQGTRAELEEVLTDARNNLALLDASTG